MQDTSWSSSSCVASPTFTSTSGNVEPASVPWIFLLFVVGIVRDGFEVTGTSCCTLKKEIHALPFLQVSALLAS